MHSFFKSFSGRVAVFSEPSVSMLSAIRNLGGLHVLPIVATRSSHLVHLLTEARVSALVTDDIQAGQFVQNTLGIPIFPLSTHFGLDQAPCQLLLEGRTFASSIPRVAQITDWKQQIANNQLLFSQPPGNFLSLSRNWFLDTESFGSTNGFATTPDTIFVDNESIEMLKDQIEAGTVSVENLKRIVIEVPFIDELPDIGSLAEFGVKVSLRHSVPELGPFAQLISAKDWDPSIVGSALPGFELSLGEVLSVKHSLGWTYLNRSQQEPSEGSHFITSIKVKKDVEIEKLPLRRKRRIMQPDWRVKKVPIAVYHKKRGAKGQIYVTTKHKGWTFYKSRY